MVALFSAHADAKEKQARLPAEKPVHRLLIQVNQNDPAVMNLALNNATNVLEYYRGRGERADVEIVAFGPGCTCCAKTRHLSATASKA